MPVLFKGNFLYPLQLEDSKNDVDSFGRIITGEVTARANKGFEGIVQAKMVKIVKFLFFAQKVSSGMGALRPKFLGG